MADAQESIEALERRARELLPEGVYDYFATGAGDEQTLAANVAAWSELTLAPRALRDVSTVDLSTTVLGAPVTHPILVAPSASHRLAHPDGEAATIAGAAAAGSPLVVSTRASLKLEAIAAAAPDHPRWFQVYVMRDRGWTRELIARAVQTGFSALVLTADTPYVSRKRRSSIATLKLPEDVYMANRPSSLPAGELADWQDPSITFETIQWLREQSGLPVLAKGVLRADDARRSLDAGADGVIVSNHGGRQLDRAVATARALPAIADEVADDGEVYVDGGIRSGLDVLCALALGARAVLIGRPVLWGLATGGADGVRAVLERLRDELYEAAALAGASTVDEITRDLIA